MRLLRPGLTGACLQEVYTSGHCSIEAGVPNQFHADAVIVSRGARSAGWMTPPRARGFGRRASWLSLPTFSRPLRLRHQRRSHSRSAQTKGFLQVTW
jgi:hypothetical protein